MIFAEPPPGYEREGQVWQLLRNSNGRRTGSMRWFEWLTAQVLNLSRPFVQDPLDPCVFHCPSFDVHWVFHVDDGAATGPRENNKVLLAELASKVLLKTSGPLHHTYGVCGPLTCLSRERIWDGSGLSTRPNPKFVDQAAM